MASRYRIHSPSDVGTMVRVRTYHHRYQHYSIIEIRDSVAWIVTVAIRVLKIVTI